MTGRYRLRVAHLLVRRGVAVAVVLLLLGVAAGGAAGYTYVHQDDTATVTERTHVQTVRLAANDSAVVTGETPLWSKGTRLNDHPAYLLGATPTLAVTSRTSTPADAEVTLRQRVVLVVTAAVDGDAIWTDEWPVDARRATVTNGRFRSRTTVDVPRVVDRLERLRSEIAAPVTLSVRLEVRTRYDTGRYAGTLSTSAPLAVGDRTYSVGPLESVERTHEQRVTRRVERADPVPPTRTLAAGAVALLALVGVAVTGFVRRRVDDPDRLRHRLNRAQFDAWISTGRVPEDAGTTTVTMSSLADLVDVAIDSNRRAVYDERRGVYAVLDGETVYEYRDAATVE